MKITIAQLAKLLSNAATKGHGAMEVNIHFYASEELKQVMEPESGPITRVPVERDATGRWAHPCFPDECQISMRAFLRHHGFDYTANYLIKPDDYNPDDISNCELVTPTHRGRAGKWFCFKIDTNTDGEPIAVFIAPIE